MTTVVVNGFFVGLVYGLLAVGLVVVYRGSRTINFAYGATGMLGAFVFSELWASAHIGRLPAPVLGVAVSATLGALTEACSSGRSVANLRSRRWSARSPSRRCC